MIKLRVGGVPEHFNLPWHLAADGGGAAGPGVDVAWRDYPDGSGAMAAALRGGELDAALLLTEAAVAGVANRGGFKIASLYVESPLIWGIHVPAGSALHTVADVQGARYAISRLGSGSHLMAYVHARAQGWAVDKLTFVTVSNLEGAIRAFESGTADVFFWERFMTKPLVDSGRFRLVGEFRAPWPAFVLCVADAVGADRRSALATLLAAVLEHANALVSRSDAAMWRNGCARPVGHDASVSTRAISPRSRRRSSSSSWFRTDSSRPGPSRRSWRRERRRSRVEAVVFGRYDPGRRGVQPRSQVVAPPRGFDPGGRGRWGKQAR
jgi:sulfonate transport system substrate-binding protein